MFNVKIATGACCLFVAVLLGVGGCSAGDPPPESSGKSTDFVVAAGPEAVSLGIQSWSLDKKGEILGLAATGTLIVRFHSLADRAAIESTFPETGIKELSAIDAKSSFSAKTSAFYDSFVSDLKARAEVEAKHTAKAESGKIQEGLVYSIVVGCCNGCGPTSSAQITKWVGDQYPAGYCHITYTGSSCYVTGCDTYDPFMCWNNTGGCYYWY